MIIPETTADERLLIMDTVDALFNDVECATRLLDGVRARFFVRAPQRAIPEDEAAYLADQLYAIYSLLYESALAYALTVGKDENVGACNASAAADTIESLDRARRARQVTELLCEVSNERRQQLSTLPDDEIIAALAGSDTDGEPGPNSNGREEKRK